jgi:hypothetical protein
MSVKTRNVPANRFLRVAGFVQRPPGGGGPIRFMVHCTDDDDVCALLRDPDRWLITSTDCHLEDTLDRASTSPGRDQAVGPTAGPAP